MLETTCPLCLAEHSQPFHRDKQREYLRCGVCMLVFVTESRHLSPAAEKALYDLHQNQTDDPGYWRFLSRLATPLFARLPPAANGLDYGCGPGPALAEILRAAGHTVQLFDPIYANDLEHLNNTYQFITCTEVVEHFRQPRQEFDRLFGMLQADGWLAIMTKLVIDADAFSRWHYKNDPTHIAFFSQPTFAWLARHYDCRVEFVGKDVIILQRNRRHCRH